MKRLMILVAVILLSALPVLAAQPADKAPPQLSAKSQKFEREQEKRASEGRKLHKAYFQQRDEMKTRRDQAMQLRDRNIRKNSPGNTGL